MRRRRGRGIAELVAATGRRGHSGGTWGFRSFAAFARQSGVAVVVLANTSRSVDRLGLSLLEALETNAR